MRKYYEILDKLGCTYIANDLKGIYEITGIYWDVFDKMEIGDKKSIGDYSIKRVEAPDYTSLEEMWRGKYE